MTEGRTGCLYCHSLNSSLLYSSKDETGENWDLLLCDDCGISYLSPIPSNEILNQAYDPDYYGTEEEKFWPVIEYLLNKFRHSRAALASHYIKEGNILDIGCGNGKFLHFLGIKGNYNLFGIELDGRAASRAAKYPEIKLSKKAIAHGDFEKASMNGISMFHVFEHLDKPGETLDIVDNILLQGGVFMVSFPNIRSLQARILKGNWLHLDPPRHLTLFPPRIFEKLMKERGYTLLKKNYFSPEHNPFGAIQGILNVFNKRRNELYNVLKGQWRKNSVIFSPRIIIQMLFFLFTFPIFFLTDIFASIFKTGATVEYIFRKDGIPKTGNS